MTEIFSNNPVTWMLITFALGLCVHWGLPHIVKHFSERSDADEEGLKEIRAPYQTATQSELNMVLEQEGNVYRGYHVKFKTSLEKVNGLTVCGFAPTRYSPSEKPDADDCLKLGNLIMALWGGREPPKELFEICSSSRKILSSGVKVVLSEKSYLVVKAVINSYTECIDSLIIASLETQSSDEPNSALVAVAQVRQQLVGKPYKVLLDSVRDGVYVGDEL